MDTTYQQISLLYELSLTTIGNEDPEATAGKFIRKILARKNLNYGAIWIYEGDSGDYRNYRKLYSMPHVEGYATIRSVKYESYFEKRVFGVSEHPLFEDGVRRGYYAYIKLGDFGLVELFSRNSPEKLSIDAVYPLVDVISHLAIALRSGFRYQRLQDEIAERRKAEERVKAQEEKYRRIIDSIHLGLIEVDMEGVIRYANKSFCKMVEYKLAELVGMKARSLLLEPEVHRYFDKTTNERPIPDNTPFEVILKDKYNNEIWVIVSLMPTYDEEGKPIGYVGIHLEITEQKQLERELAFKESQRENLFNQSLDAVITIDKDGLIMQYNKQAERTFGYTESEILGASLMDTLVPERYRKPEHRRIGNYIGYEGGTILNKRIEHSALRRNGEEFPVEVTIFKLIYKKEHYFTGFIRDITELKASRDSMVTALDKQKELNKLKSRFISMTSHELRTPLTTISNDVEILDYQLENMAELSREKLKRSVGRIGASTERLNQLINNILLIGKMDTNKVPFSPRMMDVDSFIRKKVQPHFPDLEVKSSGSPYEVYLDPNLLSHILDNLVQNAYKYSEGSRPPELEMKFTDGFTVAVRDYGIGIPEADQSRLFDTFFRASNVGNVQGSGLGLAIVKEFMNLHEGFINFESTEGEGTTFIIHFPERSAT